MEADRSKWRTSEDALPSGPTGALIGPNAILQLLPQIERAFGEARAVQLLAKAHVFDVPDGSQMIPEGDAARLHQVLLLAEIFAGIDTNSKGLWKELSEEQRKSVSFWLLNRYASAVSGNRDAQELAVVMTNEIYNKNWNELGVKHPQLQWQLLCATHNAASSIRRHNWIGFKKKTGDNSKSVKLLEQLYPNMKRDEVELLARIHTKKELKELAKEHDIDIKL